MYWESPSARDSDREVSVLSKNTRDKTSQRYRLSQVGPFFDLQCPYSKKAWETIGNSISNVWGEQLNIYFQPICLSQHRQSWDLTRTLFAIQYFDEEKVIDYVNLIYSDHDQFYIANWVSRGQNVFLKFINSLLRDVITPRTMRLKSNVMDVVAKVKFESAGSRKTNPCTQPAYLIIVGSSMKQEVSHFFQEGKIGLWAPWYCLPISKTIAIQWLWYHPAPFIEFHDGIW